jgi:nucleosome assembly protein 1-like 1
MKPTDLDLKKYELKICNTVAGIDENVRGRFKALAHISDKLADLSKLYEEECKKIEFEAEQVDKPLFVLRSRIVLGEPIDGGEHMVSEFDKRLEEIMDEGFHKIKIKEHKSVENLLEKPGIPGFWLNAMKNNPLISPMIEKKDEKLLMELVDIENIPQKDSHDFILKFHFNTNDYIQNTVITKRYIMEDEEKVKQINCTTVKWRPDMNLLEKQKPKKKNKKGKKKAKQEQEDEPAESFFIFFTQKEPTSGNADEDDLDTDDEIKLDALEEDHDIGVELKSELIPNALEYYLNINEEEMIEEAEGEDDEEAQLDGEVVDGKKDKDDDSNNSQDD